VETSASGESLKSTAIFLERDNSAESAISPDQYVSPVPFKKRETRVCALYEKRGGEDPHKRDSVAEGSEFELSVPVSKLLDDNVVL